MVSRYAFYVFWVVLVPMVLAGVGVWLLTPSPTHTQAGGLRVFVSEQQIPVAIVLFTVFAMAAWKLRYSLPFSNAAGIGGRRDVPPAVRGRFDEAAALLDEARRIQRVRRRQIERELAPAERDKLESALSALERVMSAQPFDREGFDAVFARADRAVGEHLGRWRKGELREYAESIGIAVAVALLLRAFAVEAFKIPSGSMIPTLMVGDHIFVNKFTYGPVIPWLDYRLLPSLPPARADVMVFKFPEDESVDFIKRTIALPGDTLEAIDGRPVINGWLVPHCDVGPIQYEGRPAELFVEYLGDKSYLTLYENKPDEQLCPRGDECTAGLACRGGVCGILQGPFKAKPGEVWVMGDNRNNSHDSRSWFGGLGGGVPFQNIKGRAMFVWMSFHQGGGIATHRLLVNVMGRPQIPAGEDPALTSKLQKCLDSRPANTSPPPAP